jgi:hypothetical protein
MTTADANNPTSTNNDIVYGGKISFTAGYPIEDSSTMSKGALEEWWQRHRKFIPLDKQTGLPHQCQ